ncbi:hypothetical protein EYF80_029720 [Liparis tanakae]|uniref:Uncharacterized protein n=1 Tax=Liparis tanakae TaxID=230148 RepID=A0A4Z2H372_9TELE|nr:hypothetical protein EYF80_029720 [Liparis tanakae]
MESRRHSYGSYHNDRPDHELLLDRHFNHRRERSHSETLKASCPADGENREERTQKTALKDEREITDSADCSPPVPGEHALPTVRHWPLFLLIYILSIIPASSSTSDSTVTSPSHSLSSSSCSRGQKAGVDLCHIPHDFPTSLKTASRKSDVTPLQKPSALHRPGTHIFTMVNGSPTR